MNIQFLKDNNLIIFEAIAGSHAYGTNIASSDKDIRGVFVLPKEYLYGMNYIEQVNDKTNDIVYYELRRFLELTASNNPNILEFFGMPEECIITKHPVFDLILENKEKFITKLCKNSFAGYAKSQISKSAGLNKKQNWEAKRVTKKTPLDFCYMMDGYRAVKLKGYLKKMNMEQKFCGLSKVSNVRDVYALFYDEKSHKCFSESIPEKKRLAYKNKLKKAKQTFGLKYKGIEADDSHVIRLSSIPKGEKHLCNIYYNQDGYSMWARDWKSYQTWLRERNEARYVTNKDHGQSYDSKNIMHLVRLLDMSYEIAKGKGINVRRKNSDYLLKIRRGEIDLKTVIAESEAKIKIIDELFTKSKLPDSVDLGFVNKLLIEIRQKFYGEYSFAH